MKNEKGKNQIEKKFDYDSMLYKDIEKDLEYEKTQEKKKISNKKKIVAKNNLKRLTVRVEITTK